ncbi:unnamed protein product [Auanema sp. JU1783]|nr:unnamed protein product [Auanema sp. JU1783]
MIRLLVICLILCNLVSSFGYEKKSQFDDLSSVLKSVERLRYGKRSQWIESAPSPSSADDGSDLNFLIGDGFPSVKRSTATHKLIQSLKGIDRLRFGRK